MQTVRLSKHIRPERYRLIIKPDLKDFNFEGEETIYLELKKTSKEITLHAKELSVSDVVLKIGKNKIPFAKQIFDGKSETITFLFKRPIPAGKGELSLKFKGVLNDKMRGFYRSRYFHQNREKHLATTQFEATDARRAFPCFDEPAQKAVFDVTLMVPAGLSAISNTVETEIAEHESGYKLVKFAPTPKMSTYLLAFIVGEFEFVETKSRHGVTVRVFTTPGKKRQAEFALQTAAKCLDFYTDYFKIPYPLPVLDLIAVPDFSSAAMENWGAITYRETALLVDEDNSSLATKQWVAIVIAHEIAHQWFGNLVTMEWWTHLWLNEGFASYMEYLCTDKLFPQWKLWEQYVAQRFNTALELDSLKNTHPIEVEVNRPEEISEIFDAVSYAKGSVVLRMLAGYLGEEKFRDGLRYYLKKHAYGNAATDDLWAALEKISGKPAKKIMHGWTGQAGYPVVRVIEQPKKILLRQERFFLSPLSEKKSAKNQLWKIPLAYSYNSKNTKKILFSNKSIKISKPEKGFIKLNWGEKSLVRIDYPAQMLTDFASAIKTKKLSASDRLGVIRDVFSLAEAGQLPTIQALKLAQSYSAETDYNVWLALATGINSVGNLAYHTRSYENYRKFALSLYREITAEVGFKQKKNEASSETLLRSLVLQQAGKWGDKKVIAWAKNEFSRPAKPEANLRSVVYNLAAANGGIEAQKKLFALYKNEPQHEEQERIGRALAQFRQPELLQKTLEFSLSSSVRRQDAPFILAAVFRNPFGAPLALKFVQKNWRLLLERYASGLSMISRIVSVMDNFYFDLDAKNISKFFKIHKAPGAKRSLQQTLEKISAQALWLKRDCAHLEKFLRDINV